jgi:pimeloyl-ACP methyl ester carboxylesterase
MLTVSKDTIIEQESVYHLQNSAKLYAKTLEVSGATGKCAIYIHGGGSGGNHTIVSRPSYWLLNQGYFTKIIMPDRRGAANSSPITARMTYEDNARDMKQLLDNMGVTGKITAIGISYGGPIALTLAAIDERVEQVILVASSPSLKPAKGIVGLLYRKGLLEKMVKSIYSKQIGKLCEQYPDFDNAYDAKSITELKKIFMMAIQHTSKNRLQSLLLENASTCDSMNACIDKRLKINVPVLRVIGTKDETWEVELGDRYKDQIPNMETTYIQGAGHKDVFFRASDFYNALSALI